MRVSINFDCDNEAFIMDEEEIDKVLARAAHTIRHTPCGPNGFSSVLRDSNGNMIGKVVVEV